MYISDLIESLTNLSNWASDTLPVYVDDNELDRIVIEVSSTGDITEINLVPAD